MIQSNPTLRSGTSHPVVTIRLGRPMHFLLPNKATACGLVGTYMSTTQHAYVNCVSCMRTKKFNAALG